MQHFDIFPIVDDVCKALKEKRLFIRLPNYQQSLEVYISCFEKTETIQLQLLNHKLTKLCAS